MTSDETVQVKTPLNQQATSTISKNGRKRSWGLRHVVLLGKSTRIESSRDGCVQNVPSLVESCAPRFGRSKSDSKQLGQKFRNDSFRHLICAVFEPSDLLCDCG